MRLVGACLLWAAVVAAGALTTSAQNALPLDAPRPIEAGDSLWAEELTSMEMRDAVRAGTTTIIVGTGGVEQNGPYVVSGKHNYVLQTVLPFIARAIGGALDRSDRQVCPGRKHRADHLRSHAVLRHDRCRGRHI